MALTTLLTIAACSLGGPGLHPEPPVATLADLAFMTGVWEGGDDSEGDGEHTGELVREVWDEARGNSMVGHFSMVAAGEAVLYELLVIEMEAAGPVMRLRHFGRGLEPWASEASGPLAMPLVECAGDRAVFEDPDRSFPRRIIYTREGDTLRTQLEPGPNSAREPIIITFQRTKL